MAILPGTLPHFSLKARQLSPVQLLAIKYSSEKKHGGISEPERDEKTAMQLDLEEPDVRVRTYVRSRSRSRSRKASRMRVTIFTA